MATLVSSHAFTGIDKSLLSWEVHQVDHWRGFPFYQLEIRVVNNTSRNYDCSGRIGAHAGSSFDWTGSALVLAGTTRTIVEGEFNFNSRTSSPSNIDNATCTEIRNPSTGEAMPPPGSLDQEPPTSVDTGGRLDIECPCDIFINPPVIFPGRVNFDGEVKFRARRISNTRTVSTSGLRLSVWATTTPYRGGTLSGYELGARHLLSIPAGETRPPANSLSGLEYTVPFFNEHPPSGTYNIVIVLEEDGRIADYYASGSVSFENNADGGSFTGTSTGGSGNVAPVIIGSDKTVDLICPCNVNNQTGNSNQINISASRVVNLRGERSGLLTLQVWATSTRYTGGVIRGHLIGQHRFDNTLVANGNFSNINQNVQYAEPPDGTYFVTLILTESILISPMLMDYVTFSNRITVSSQGAGTFSSSSVTTPVPLTPVRTTPVPASSVSLENSAGSINTNNASSTLLTNTNGEASGSSGGGFMGMDLIFLLLALNCVIKKFRQYQSADY